jgi:hypothetical protein
MQSQLSSHVASLGQEVKKKVDEEFKTEKITKLVTDTAQTRIDTIADPIITNIISNKIQPKLDEVDKNVNQIKNDIEAARNNLQTLNKDFEFLDIVASAQNGDRISFDKLERLAYDKKFSKQLDAKRAWENIVNTFGPIFEPNYTLTLTEVLAKGADLSKLSFETLKYNYSKYDSYEIRAGILQTIWQRKDFSKKQKMGLMIEAMKQDKNLYVVAEASRMFQTESKQNIKRLLIYVMVDWWDKNKQTFSDKPEIVQSGQ